MTSSEVKQMQRALREVIDLTIVVNGVYGNQTSEALQRYALAMDAPLEEAKALLLRYSNLRFVSDAAFTQVATLLAVKESYVRAIAEVESAGESFLKDGRVKILFERHWFYRKLKEALVASKDTRVLVAARLKIPQLTGPDSVGVLLTGMTKYYSSICHPDRGGYEGGGAEWDRLNMAMDFDIEAACQSASYGGYQIMGFNCKASGFANAKDMMIRMAESESAQFLAVGNFIKANPTMHAALKTGNWAGFASAYNGSAYKENHYDTKLDKAEAKWATIA